MVQLTLPEPAKADLTPMADVTFLLLAFFVATLNFSRLEGQVDASLPREMTGCGGWATVEQQRIIILVADPNPESRRVRYEVGERSFRSLVQLSSHLQTLDARRIPVTLDPRRGVIVQEVLRVLDVVLQHDFERIYFAGTLERD